LTKLLQKQSGAVFMPHSVLVLLPPLPLPH